MNCPLFPPQRVALNKRCAQLELTWRNGEVSIVSGDEMRRFCACSGCRSRRVVGLRLITDCAQLDAVALLGNNALQAVFSDGHDRGIYPWPYLYAIAQGQAQAYLDE